MKQILVLGAGQSTPYLINYLLDEAQKHKWFVTVGDLNLANAQKAVGNHPGGSAIHFDINDAVMRSTQIKKADVVVSMLSPIFHHLVALECVNHGAHMVSASYESKKIKALDLDAHRRNLLILNEMGLDPGIDHMSAMKLIQHVRDNDGQISAFLSYGSGIPAPDMTCNPLRYCITWNARNITRAGEVGALYKEQGKIKVLAYHHVFHRTWPVEVEGVGTLEAYPNRNSLIYEELFGLDGVRTMIRGTLRYPGWSETWSQIVRLGITNDTMPIPNLHEMTYRKLLEMFLSINVSGGKLENRVANLLQINPTGKIMENLKWLGLFEDEIIGGDVYTAADVLTNLLVKKLALPENGRDMVILQHEIEATYPKEKNRRERILATMIEYGKAGKYTAMSKTVGLPGAIAVKLILTNKLPLTGCHIPTHPAIYEPVLKELKKLGLTFTEKFQEIRDEA